MSEKVRSHRQRAWGLAGGRVTVTRGQEVNGGPAGKGGCDRVLGSGAKNFHTKSKTGTGNH